MFGDFLIFFCSKKKVEKGNLPKSLQNKPFKYAPQGVW